MPPGSPSPDPTSPQAPPPYGTETPLPTSESPEPDTTARSIAWTFVKLADGGRRVFLSYTTGGGVSPGVVGAAARAPPRQPARGAQGRTGHQPAPRLRR